MQSIHDSQGSENVTQSSDTGSKRAADFVFQVPLKSKTSSGDELTVRVLLEHKSKLAVKPLTRQLLTYQYGLYEQNYELPIINVVVSNGKSPKFERRCRFRENFVGAFTEGFWQQFDPYVLGFSALVVHLRNPELREQLETIHRSTGLGWYALGKEGKKLDEKFMAGMIEIMRKMSDREIQKLLRPVMGYRLVQTRFSQLKLYESQFQTVKSTEAMRHTCVYITSSVNLKYTAV